VNVDDPENFPIGFPADAHFSQFTVAAHNEDYTMFKVGGKATPGMERKAEFGMGDILEEELQAAADVSDIAVSELAPVIAEIENGIGETQQRTVTITVDAEHPYLSGSAMIAPSSAWFTGFDTIPMCNEVTGKWVEELTLKVAPVYDAGTDIGHCFDCPDQDANNPMSILYCDGRAFCDSENDDTLVDLGKFTFTAENDAWARLRNFKNNLMRAVERNSKSPFANIKGKIGGMRRAEVDECLTFQDAKTCETLGQEFNCEWKFNRFCRSA